MNWIESKALFGDDATHSCYITSQLSPYWNRYGPGMVIYWHGFVEEILDHERFAGVIVVDSLPQDSELIRWNPFWDLAIEEEKMLKEYDDDEEAREKEKQQDLTGEMEKLKVNA